MQITVLVDIYPNRFSPNLFIERVYANVRAINIDQQHIVEECIKQMLEKDDVCLLDPELIVLNDNFYPYEKDKKCTLDTVEQKFIF